jgi:RNA polymerase sigma factor (sigma-70 family)
MSSDNGTTTVQIDRIIERLDRGELSARDELVERSLNRIAALSCRQIRSFPAVARWAEAEDVLQGAAQRLHRALGTVRPNNSREYFNLAAALIRRELIDLKRKHFGPNGIGANHASPATPFSSEAADAAFDPANSTDDPEKLACWTEFHEQVTLLPPPLREVFDLIWYEQLTHEQAAQVLGVAKKTISRRWREARIRLHHLMEGDQP